MKKSIYLFVLLLCGLSVQAQDVIKFTWDAEAGKKKGVNLFLTDKKQFQVDWGDQTETETLTGSHDLEFFLLNATHIYAKNGIYEVTVTGLDANCHILDISLSKNNIKTIDVSNVPKLTYLSCSNNELCELDVSQNKELEVLDCCSNLLTELDLSNNPKITELFCQDNQMRIAQLYETFRGMVTPENFNVYLGPQVFEKETVSINTPYVLTETLILGENNTETLFWVYKGDYNDKTDRFLETQAVPGIEYTITNGVIRFLRVGNYWVEIENRAIAFPLSDEGIEAIPFTVQDRTSISKLSEPSFNLWSTNAQLHIELAEASPVEIYNITGSLVYKDEPNEGINTIDLRAGIYLIKAEGQTRKVIVK